MNNTELENKLTIFKYALRHMDKIISNQIDDVCDAIIKMSVAIHHQHEDTLDNQTRVLRLRLVSAIEDTQDLLMIFKELEAWNEKNFGKSSPFPDEKSQNETNKEDKKNE